MLQRLVPALVEPFGSISDDGTLTLTWEKGDLHFDLEIHPETRGEWFFMDRSRDLTRGGVAPAVFLPSLPEFLRRLAQVGGKSVFVPPGPIRISREAPGLEGLRVSWDADG